MMIVVERAEALMPRNLESKSLCDPLYREVAELLQFILIHDDMRGYRSFSPPLWEVGRGLFRYFSVLV